MKSGLARLAAALALTVGVVVLAFVVWLHYYRPSTTKCEATAVHALPKGSRFDHGSHGADVTYQLPDDPGPSVASIERTLRKRGELRGVRRDGLDRYDQALIVLDTPCTTATITVRRISPPDRGATAEIETRIET